MQGGAQNKREKEEEKATSLPAPGVWTDLPCYPTKTTDEIRNKVTKKHDNLK